MGLGIKRLFKKKSKSGTKTPSKSKPPTTPPTKDAGATPGTTVGSPGGYSEELPVRNLLDDLNVHAGEEHGDTELVLGDLPSDLDATDEGQDRPNPFKDADTDEVEVPVETPVETPVATPTGVALADAVSMDDEEISESSPLAPRRLDEEAVENLIQRTESNEGAIKKAEETPQKDPPAETPQTQDNTPNDTSMEVTPHPDDEPDDQTMLLRQRLMGIFESASQLASSLVLPEPIQKLVPTAENALCQPLRGTRSDLSHTDAPQLERQYSYYDDQFALKFLDEILNVGYALVQHQQLVDDEEEDEEDGDWVGRSVTLIMRPGVCNALKVVPPCLEWSTMGGGQQASVETTTISLLDIHSITSSQPEDTSETPAEDQEDLKCFFTLTTKSGQVFVMEAITADESQRLVAGIKNLTARITRQLIAGDAAVFTDFFDNADEPLEIRFGTQEALFRLSHVVLDDLVA